MEYYSHFAKMNFLFNLHQYAYRFIEPVVLRNATPISTYNNAFQSLNNLILYKCFTIYINIIYVQNVAYCVIN